MLAGHRLLNRRREPVVQDLQAGRVILDINKTIDYQRYVNLLNDWGAQCGWNAVQVEKAIFGLSTGR